MGHDFSAQQRVAQGIVITLRNIIAFIQPASADKHTVMSVRKGPEDEFKVHPAGAHNANKPDVASIL